MTDTRKWLIRRLRDARRMEKLSETMLARQAQRIEGYPALAGRIRQHIEQTKTEADRLHDLLEASGEHPVAERLASELVVLSEDLGSVLSGEEVVKAALGIYVLEHVEVAVYRLLIAAAEQLGDTEVERACRTTLQEEIAMSKWLEEQLPAITHAFLDRPKPFVQEADADTAEH